MLAVRWLSSECNKPTRNVNSKSPAYSIWYFFNSDETSHCKSDQKRYQRMQIEIDWNIVPCTSQVLSSHRLVPQTGEIWRVGLACVLYTTPYACMCIVLLQPIESNFTHKCRTSGKRSEFVEANLLQIPAHQLLLHVNRYKKIWWLLFTMNSTCAQFKNIAQMCRTSTQAAQLCAWCDDTCCLWWLLNNMVHKTSSAAHPRSSTTVESDDRDLVADVHWNYNSVCAQFRYSAQMCTKPMQAHLGAWCSDTCCI